MPNIVLSPNTQKPKAKIKYLPSAVDGLDWVVNFYKMQSFVLQYTKQEILSFMDLVDLAEPCRVSIEIEFTAKKNSSKDEEKYKTLYSYVKNYLATSEVSLARSQTKK